MLRLKRFLLGNKIAEHNSYLSAFRAFNDVVHACFSYDYISVFKNAWFALDLPFTCKMHLLIEHLPEELEKYQMGTALLNESAGEALHADFDRHYQGFIVKDIGSLSYQRKLLQAVQIYNANHV